MNQTNLSKWLKFITIAVGVMGMVMFLAIIPEYGKELISINAEYAGWYWPWLMFIWIMAVPCYMVLVCFWSVCMEIERDNSFSEKNAKTLGTISKLAIGDTILCFFGNAVFLVLNMSHPAVFLIFLFVIFAGVAVAIVAAALSHLVEKASKIQEENNLTI